MDFHGSSDWSFSHLKDQLAKFDMVSSDNKIQEEKIQFRQ